MPDTELRCCDCGSTFSFSEGERRFFEQRGLVPPKRCKRCRDAKKMRNNARPPRDARGIEEPTDAV